MLKIIKLSEGTIKYHLNFLLKKNLIVKKTESGYNRFFVQGKIGIKEQKIVALFREEVPRNILLFLLITFVSSRVELGKELEKDVKTIAYHLKKLKDMNIIEQAPIGENLVFTNIKNKPVERAINRREKVFRLKEPYLIYHYIMIYKNNFLDDGTSEKIIKWLEFLSGKTHGSIFLNPKSYPDRVIDKMYDIFPHPYHI